MSTIHLSDGQTFEAPPGVPLLDAARTSGLVLAHSCRTGRCGTCKAQVTAGETAATGTDLSLSAGEQAAGWVLTCVTAARSDLQLAAEAIAMPPGYDVRTLPCRIHSLERLAPDVMRVVLRLPPRSNFRHLPGQYIDLIGPGGVKRSYSLANTVGEDGLLELHVRQVEGGALSRYWFEQARHNDLLRFEGPRGTFFLRPTAGRDLVFLATGTGIAPIKAMLSSLATQPPAQRPRSLHLCWGGRVPADLYWTPDGEGTGLVFEPVLSRADTSWTGARGWVQDRVLQRAWPWAETDVYACGSAAMVDSARSALLAAGLPARQYHADAFVSSE